MTKNLMMSFNQKDQSKYTGALLRRFCLLLAMWLTSGASMSETKLLEASIEDLQQAMAQEELTAVELVNYYLARIEAYDQQNSALNAIIRINPQALKRAAELDREREKNGPMGPLHGIPVILKDNFNTKGLATTAGSVALAGFIPKTDSLQVKRLKDAGAIILAKANMDELARDVLGNSSLGGQSKNPYDLRRNPGGSSAGSAVAVAANFATVGMGTDTCGSLRVPASFNGLVALRPTKNQTGIEGIIPLSVGEDAAGPLTRSVRDLAVMMDVVTANRAAADAGTLPRQTQVSGFVAQVQQIGLRDLRVGKLAFYFDPNQKTPVNEVINHAMDRLKAQGLTIVDIDTSVFEALLKEIAKPPHRFTYSADMEAYFKAHPNSRFDSVIPFEALGLYHEFIDQWMPLKNFIDSQPSPQQVKSMSHWRALLSQAIEQTMHTHNLDALIYPSVQITPAKLGEPQQGNNCALSAYSGMPALSLPAGITAAGLPVGLELLGASMSDQKLVAIGYAIEQVLQARRPPLTTPALVDGKAPTPITFPVRIGASVEVALTFDQTQNTLAYLTRYLTDKEIYAVCLHRSKLGPVIQCLSGIQGRRRTGTVTLNNGHIAALKKGELYLRIYSPSSPKGQKKKRVILPSR